MGVFVIKRRFYKGEKEDHYLQENHTCVTCHKVVKARYCDMSHPVEHTVYEKKSLGKLFFLFRNMCFTYCYSKEPLHNIRQSFLSTIRDKVASNYCHRGHEALKNTHRRHPLRPSPQ